MTHIPVTNKLKYNVNIIYCQKKNGKIILR